MKSFLLTALTAALVIPAAAAPALAQDHRPDNHGKQVSRVAPQHHFQRGQKFDRRQATNYREINYRSDKRLKAPPRGYHWVRSGNDAVLVGVTSGIVSAVIASMYR